MANINTITNINTLNVGVAYCESVPAFLSGTAKLFTVCCCTNSSLETDGDVFLWFSELLAD